MTNKQNLYKGCWIQDKSGQYGTVERFSEYSDWIRVDFGSHSEWIKYGNLEIVQARTL